MEGESGMGIGHQQIKVIILMGVSGSGKTYIGNQLATHLDWEFVDADDFHSPQNKNKMKAGEPLTDADRASWLATLAEQIAHCLLAQKPIILACSALKHRYRQQLWLGHAQVKWVYLWGDRTLLQQRIQARQHEYMNPDLLDSQLVTLQEPTPTEALWVEIKPDPVKILAQIIRDLNLKSA
jgi:gluconokinase